MWYIKRAKSSPQFLSVFGGWRSKNNPTVSDRDKTKPLLQQWREELMSFENRRDAELFKEEKGKTLRHAILVNGLIT